MLSRPNLHAVLDFHSYGELIVYPWGHIPDPPPDDELYQQLGGELRQEIHAVHGHWYDVIQGYSDYQTSGEIVDWVYGDAGILCYTIELRPRFSPGFLLPEDEILPTCEEILPAALHLARWAAYAETEAPTGLLAPGWNWLSIPVWPDNPDPASFLGAENVTNRLIRYDRLLKTAELYPDDFTTVAVGEGYALYASHVLDSQFGGVGTGGDFAIDLPTPGWSWIGHPHQQPLALADVLVTDQASGATRTAAEDAAASVPWLNWNWIFWDSSARTPKLLSMSGGDDTSLRPWYGYAVWVNRGGLTLTIPLP
jgi:hypothetical protein